jgi:hypothetical protein
VMDTEKRREKDKGNVIKPARVLGYNKDTE